MKYTNILSNIKHCVSHMISHCNITAVSRILWLYGQVNDDSGEFAEKSASFKTIDADNGNVT